MIEANDLDKHPIRYATQYLSEILEQLSKPKVVENITFSVREKILLVTCKNDEDYQTLKQCETMVDKEFVEKLRLKVIVFQYDKDYLVLKIIKKFAKEGLKEVSFESIFNEVNKYTPSRTAQAVKGVLASFANDLTKDYRQQSRANKDFLSLRGLDPLVKRLKDGSYELLAKPVPVAKSSTRKKAK